MSIIKKMIFICWLMLNFTFRKIYLKDYSGRKQSHIMLLYSQTTGQCNIRSYLCCSSLWSEPGIVRTSSWPWNKRITCPPRRYPIGQMRRLSFREGFLGNPYIYPVFVKEQSTLHLFSLWMILFSAEDVWLPFIKAKTLGYSPSAMLLPEQVGWTFHNVCMKDASTWMCPLEMDRCCERMNVAHWSTW